AGLRQRPAGLERGDGTGLVAGGSSDGGATVLGSTERFVPGAATFSALAATLGAPRWRAEAVRLSSVGLLFTGGVDRDGKPIAEAELYAEATGQLLPVTDARLDARVGHRVVV